MLQGAPTPEESHFDRARFELYTRGLKQKEVGANPLRTGIHTRGYLPHIKIEGASYFVTFRLQDSLPRPVLMELERQRAESLQKGDGKKAIAQREEINRNFQRSIERFLDTGAGACHLRKPEIARLVHQAILFFNEDRYILGDWVIMPNHVHVVLTPVGNHMLGSILKSWKTFTGREANKILGRTEIPFWQRESYDHWIRNDDERARMCRYIRNNPVTARLCSQPEDWSWSSARRATS